MELNNCISKLNSAMKDLENAIDKGTISLLMNRKEMGEAQLRNGVKDVKIAVNTAKQEFVKIVNGYTKKLNEAQQLLSASQSLVTDADLASVFDGSFQANEAVSSTPSSPQQGQSTDSKSI